MKTKIKLLSALLTGIVLTIGISTFAYQIDSISLHLEKKQLISEMEKYKQQNDELRVKKEKLEFKLKLINEKIQGNKNNWQMANGKLELIEHFLETGK